jgi:hypothetical protein
MMPLCENDAERVPTPESLCLLGDENGGSYGCCLESLGFENLYSLGDENDGSEV